MQGIFQGFELYTHDVTWTCLYDVVQDDKGRTRLADVFRVLEDNRCNVRIW